VVFGHTANRLRLSMVMDFLVLYTGICVKQVLLRKTSNNPCVPSGLLVRSSYPIPSLYLIAMSNLIQTYCIGLFVWKMFSRHAVRLGTENFVQLPKPMRLRTVMSSTDIFSICSATTKGMGYHSLCAGYPYSETATFK